MSRKAIFWLVFGLMLVIDQGVKAWVRHAIPLHGSFHGSPWPGVFELTYTQNSGIAFGMLQGGGILLAPVAVAMAGFAGWYSHKHPQEPIWTHFAMGLLAAGAIGNLYDRLALGQVTDMFWFRAIQFPVFNVADSCITVAASLFVIVWIVEAARSKPKASS